LFGDGVKVADFGLAQALERRIVNRRGGLTPPYAPPEFFQGQITRHSDQYSLAVTYCHLRGGRLPFVGSLEQVQDGHLTKDPDLTMLPAEERPAVARALAKKPQQRWPNCRAFVKALVERVEIGRPEPQPAAPAPTGELAAGMPTTLDAGKGYKMISPLGHGGFGGIWRAEGPGGVEVAIKISPHHAGTQRELEALELVKRLRHPALIGIYSFWSSEDRLLVVMELADGNLRDRLQECVTAGMSGIPPGELLTYVRETAEVLDYMHSHGVLHRDVKPASILLLQGQVKLANVDLACVLGTSTGGTICGTPAYMAPEAWRGQSSPQSDQYSLACTYVELLVGHSLFPTRDLMPLMLAHQEQQPNLSELPEDERQVLVRALAKEPERRYPNCLAFVEDLRRAVLSEPVTAPRLERWLTGLAVLFGLALLFGLGLLKSTVLKSDTPAANPVLGRWLLGLGLVAIATLILVLLFRRRRPRAEMRGVPEGIPRCDDLMGIPARGEEEETLTRLGEEEAPRVSFPSPKPPDTEDELEAEATESSWDSDSALLERRGSAVKLHRFTGHADSVWSVAVSRDGSWVLTGSLDNSVRLWDLQTGQEIRRFEGHSQGVTCVGFCLDNRLILSGSLDNTIRLWYVPSGEELRRLEGHTEGVTSVACSPDGLSALSGARDETVRLWDLQSGQEIRRFEGHTEPVWSVAFSPDGRHALSGSGSEFQGSDCGIRLWDVATGQEVRRFLGHTAAVRSVAFSPDGRFALYGSVGGNIYLWDIATGQRLRSFAAHTDWVRSVACSPDGRRILSGSDDETLRLWDLQTGAELRSFQGHDGSVTSVAFSPDGCYALSGSDDMSVGLWQLP
jgi:serine/threonine protein kinase